MMKAERLAASMWLAHGSSWLFSLSCVLVSALACKQTASVEALPARARFVVEVAALERFRIELERSDQVARAQSLLESGERSCLIGELLPGDGGFNAPYQWHLSPATVRFTRDRRSYCDALPSEVEENADHWLRDVGEYGPWAARVVAREH